MAGVKLWQGPRHAYSRQRILYGPYGVGTIKVQGTAGQKRSCRRVLNGQEDQLQPGRKGKDTAFLCVPDALTAHMIQSGGGADSVDGDGESIVRRWAPKKKTRKKNKHWPMRALLFPEAKITQGRTIVPGLKRVPPPSARKTQRDISKADI